MQSKHNNFFISYTQADRTLAYELVDKLESKGTKCFIAPRDIPSGHEYAHELIKAIDDCDIVLLVYSRASDASGYVRREINSAVSRHKMIIPLRLEDFKMSSSMEFYLGTEQWIDIFGGITDTVVDTLVAKVTGTEGQNDAQGAINKDKEKKPTKFAELQVRKISEVLTCGYKPEEITMREIEIDFEATPREKYELTEEAEGTLEDWADALCLEEYTSALLVQNDYIVGYCDAYPVSDEVYKGLCDGRILMTDEMMDIFVLGGEFNLSIPAFMVAPDYCNQRSFGLLFDWLFNHIAKWKAEEKIYIKNIVISSYNDLLEKMLQRIGFKFIGKDPVKGELYNISMADLLKSELIKNRYPELYKGEN